MKLEFHLHANPEKAFLVVFRALANLGYVHIKKDPKMLSLSCSAATQQDFEIEDTSLLMRADGAGTRVIVEKPIEITPTASARIEKTALAILAGDLYFGLSVPVEKIQVDRLALISEDEELVRMKETLAKLEQKHSAALQQEQARFSKKENFYLNSMEKTQKNLNTELLELEARANAVEQAGRGKLPWLQRMLNKILGQRRPAPSIADLKREMDTLRESAAQKLIKLKNELGQLQQANHQKKAELESFQFMKTFLLKSKVSDKEQRIDQKILELEAENIIAYRPEFPMDPPPEIRPFLEEAGPPESRVRRRFAIFPKKREADWAFVKLEKSEAPLQDPNPGQSEAEFQEAAEKAFAEIEAEEEDTGFAPGENDGIIGGENWRFDPL